jgi:hypothetical protein
VDSPDHNSPEEGTLRRVFIHVGAPKTGTTYLQQLMTINSAALAENGGIHVAGQMYGQHHAALDLRGIPPAPGEDQARAGSWNRMTDRLVASGRDGVVSTELLAWAAEHDVERARESLAGLEIHVIFTMRDLGRQIPALWQEEVKNGSKLTYDAFLDALFDPAKPNGPGDVWVGQDPRMALRWWAADLDPAHVHIVTVPMAGSDPRNLWRRFSQVLGIVADAYEPVARGANTGLGVSQASLLQRVNAALTPEFRAPHYLRYVKHGLVETSLTLAGGDAQVALPPDLLDAIKTRTRDITDFIRAQEWEVVGDLEELEPLASRPVVPANEANVGEAAVHVIADLLGRLAGAGEREDQLRRALAERRNERETHPDGHLADLETGEVAYTTPPAVDENWQPRHDPRHSDTHVVFLHVGTPTSGISALHTMFWQQRKALAGQHVLLPGRSVLDHYYAALDLRGMHETDPALADHPDAWQVLAAQVRDQRGTWLICHEQFAPLAPTEAAHAAQDLSPAEVHLVVTAPNLEDQIPRAWLRYLLHSRGQDRYDEFLVGVIQNSRQGRHDSYFWSTEDPMLVAAPWRDVVSPDRIHVVTVPPGQSCVSSVVWERLAAVLGIRASALELTVPSEPDLSPAAAAVLRQLNTTASVRNLDGTGYQRWVRDRLHARVLTSFDGAPLRIPHSHLSWRTKEAMDLTKLIANSGYDVVGSLDELTWYDALVERAQPDRLPVLELVELEANSLGDFAAELERERLAAGRFARRAARRLAHAVRRH